MSDSIIVRDDGFLATVRPADITLPSDTPAEVLEQHLRYQLIAIEFPAMTDGRGFTLARRLREIGFAGQLRAVGSLIADQYAMARRVGFDEVQISHELAARQPQNQWLARADWQNWDHRARLAG